MKRNCLTRRLISHPSGSLAAAYGITATLTTAADQSLRVRYELTGPIDNIRVPPPTLARRADELWRHTCFELFLHDAQSDAYEEFNFSPSGCWAAYKFSAYRQGMSGLNTMADPLITWLQSSQKAQLEVHLPRTMGGLMQRREKLAMGLSAVMEDCSGALSHWSLHHPSSLPDFHHREGFIAVLERSGPGSIE